MRCAAWYIDLEMEGEVTVLNLVNNVGESGVRCTVVDEEPDHLDNTWGVGL